MRGIKIWHYTPGIVRCATGRYIVAGDVPSGIAHSYATEKDAENDLRAHGVSTYQRADCSWVKQEPS